LQLAAARQQRRLLSQNIARLLASSQLASLRTVDRIHKQLASTEARALGCSDSLFAPNLTIVARPRAEGGPASDIEAGLRLAPGALHLRANLLLQRQPGSPSRYTSLKGTH
jgi:hypothetical protein